MAIGLCRICGCALPMGHVVSEHTHPNHCIEALKRRLSLAESEATFSLHERRLVFVRHPDADEGQYVLVAAFGKGEGLWGGKHELCICLDEKKRGELITLLGTLGGEPQPSLLSPEG